MLIKLNNERGAAITASINRESFDHLTSDCHYMLMPDYPSLGIRYLHYHASDHTLIICNIHHGQVHLLNLLTGYFRSFFPHKASVRKARVFNGSIYTSSWDGTVRISHYHSLIETMTLTDRTMGRCPFFNISPDGAHLYSFSYDSDMIPMGVANSVRKWCLGTGRLINLMAASAEQKSTRRSGSIIFYGDRLYVCSNSGYFRVFDIKTGLLVKDVPTHADFRAMMALFHYGYILASDWDGNIHFFNVETLKVDHILKCHNAEMLCMRLHPHNPDIIFTSSFDGVIKVWRMPGFELLGSVLTGHDQLWSMVFVNDRLLSGNNDGEIRVYDIGDLLNLKYLGRIVISGKSFVAQSLISKKFYTNNIADMEIYRADGPQPGQKEKDYLLGRGNSLEVLTGMFGLDALSSNMTGNAPFIPLLT